MARSKSHTVCVTLHFDRPISGRQAADAFRNSFYGEFWGDEEMDGFGRGRIGRVKTLQTERNA